MGRLDGKVAVITGANRGIGLACAERFAQEGARVFMTGCRQAQLNAAVAEVGIAARGVPGDVANLADLDRLYEVVRAEAGRIDVLLASAGGGDFAALTDITEAHYDRIFATNVKGTLFTVQRALPLLVDGASVVLTGSTAAVTGALAFSVYGTSKAAIRNFARGWILDLAPRRIRVNVLAPGATSPPGLQGLAADEEQDRQFVAAMEATIPLGRMGQPDEIAAAALFLASDESSFVNGNELFADSGSAQVLRRPDLAVMNAAHLNYFDDRCFAIADLRSSRVDDSDVNQRLLSDCGGVELNVRVWDIGPGGRLTSSSPLRVSSQRCAK